MTACIDRATGEISRDMIGFVFMLMLVGCFAGRDNVGGERVALRSEVGFEEDEGLVGSVVVDSLAWQPFLPLPGVGGTVEFEGVFIAVFRNVGEETVWVRYDLRFFDREEFLVDAFIPFGQPVVLDGGEVERVEGEFRIRAGDPRDFERLSLMRLVARIRWPEE